MKMKKQLAHAALGTILKNPKLWILENLLHLLGGVQITRKEMNNENKEYFQDKLITRRTLD